MTSEPSSTKVDRHSEPGPDQLGPADFDVVGIGAINMDFIASASSGSGDDEMAKDQAVLFEWGTETQVSDEAIHRLLDNLGDLVVPVLGGSAFNAMHALAKLDVGVRIGYVGIAGRVPGRSIKRILDDLGIDHEHVYRDDSGDAGMCVSCVVDGERTMWTYPGVNTNLAAHLTAHADSIVDYLARASVVHVTSLLDDKSPPVLLDLLRRARERSPRMKIVFDPGHTWATKPSPAVEGLLKLADCLLLNYKEFKALGNYRPRDTESRVAASIFSRCAPTCAVILLKQYNGATIYRYDGAQVTAEVIRHVPLESEDIEDATGAGDVFAAGLLASLASQHFQLGIGTRLGLELARAKLRFVGTTGFLSLSRLLEDFMAARVSDAAHDDWQPNVFISHGKDPRWREVKAFLEEDLGISTLSFESDSWEGTEISSAVSAYLDSCSFAVCVFTAEDKDAGGSVRPRQNVVHEAGLFHGRYGFDRVAMLIDREVEVFSNVAGVKKLHFSDGVVSTTFLALRRMLQRERLLR